MIGIFLLLAQERRVVLAELETIDMQTSAVGDQVAALDTRMGAIAAEREKNAAVLASADEELQRRRTETRERVHALYRLKRRGIARLLFDAENPSELRRRVRYLWAIIRADDTATREYAGSMEARRAAAAQLDADAAALASVQRELESRLAALDLERGRRKALLKDVQSRPDLAAQVVQERVVAAAALTGALPEPTAPANDGATFRGERGRLPAPVRGRLVRSFGPYTDPASGLTATNLGVDYAVDMGAQIRVVSDGVVVRSGYVRGYGQVVTVQHGPYATLYAHLNGLRVQQGQAVRQGDPVGLAGNSGLAEDTDGRLHFEVRYNNTPQDPAEWLAR